MILLATVKALGVDFNLLYTEFCSPSYVGWKLGKALKISISTVGRAIIRAILF